MATLKENFVSNVSHELRTPLTSINGALRLVLSGALGELPPQLDKMLHLALRNGHRLEGLISDLLDFNKLTSGQMQVQPQQVAVASLVAEALECNRALAHEHDIRLTQQIDAALRVHADPQRYRRRQGFQLLADPARSGINDDGRQQPAVMRCGCGMITLISAWSAPHSAGYHRAGNTRPHWQYRCGTVTDTRCGCHPAPSPPWSASAPVRYLRPFPRC